MNVVIIVLIAINVIVSLKGINEPFFLEKYKFQIQSIKNGESFRMLSSGFLHVDFMHLGFNMYALFLFGEIVAGNFGNLNFILIYFGSLLLGNLYTMFYHKEEPYYSAVGASGAVSGVIYAAILIYPEMTLMMFPLPIPIPGYIFGVGYLLYSIYGMKKQLGNVGHTAHLGGAIGGLVISVLLYPNLVMKSPLLVGVLTLSIVLLLIFGNKLKS